MIFRSAMCNKFLRVVNLLLPWSAYNLCLGSFHAKLLGLMGWFEYRGSILHAPAIDLLERGQHNDI
jgi:hypothetical protein